ncbi:hypothetical protein NH340_JMT01240 [Sarcoptes scabiei]|nr:hypothetical protein NH340_JMT01240 [Sarcoptes scabiei]
MDTIRAVIFILHLSLLGLCTSSQVPSECFRAAVLDHVQQTDPNNPLDYSRNVELNLKVYEKAASIAKRKGADIIVFPENGLIYHIHSRDKADLFASDIPEQFSDACTRDPKFIVNRLACIARKYQIYLAANLIDRKTCHEMKLEDSSPECPIDKKFLFNTAVLFNRNGTILGRYHKMHLFGEMALNPPPQPELVVVKTDLGRLGLQICFDMIFDKPGHFLAQKNLVDTVVFPTWWFDEAPFLASSQYQMAWAFGNNVTLLSSNIHKIEMGSRGSGIYVGTRRQFVAATHSDTLERLVLANVPKQRFSTVDCPMNQEMIVIPQEVPRKYGSKYRYQNLKSTDTKMLELSNLKGFSSYRICHKGVCCQVEYHISQRSNSSEDSCDIKDQIPSLNNLINKYSNQERYFLIAANRTRPGIFHWAEEFCALSHCSSGTKESCSTYLSENDLKTKFSYIKLWGTFSNSATVYPSVIGSKQQLMHPSKRWDSWEDIDYSSTNKKVMIELGSLGSEQIAQQYQVGSVSLYGRVYERDPKYERKAVSIDL